MKTLDLSKIAELFGDKKYLLRYTLEVTCCGDAYIYKMKCENMDLVVNQVGSFFSIFVEYGMIKDSTTFEDGENINTEVCKIIKQVLSL